MAADNLSSVVCGNHSLSSSVSIEMSGYSPKKENTVLDFTRKPVTCHLVTMCSEISGANCTVTQLSQKEINNTHHYFRNHFLLMIYYMSLRNLMKRKRR